MLHVRCTVFWMQTTGAALLAVKRCSLAWMRSAAQDGHSVCGLLYSAAVSADWREQEHRQETVDTDPSLVRHAQAVGQRRSTALIATACPPGSARVGPGCGKGWWSGRRAAPSKRTTGADGDLRGLPRQLGCSWPPTTAVVRPACCTSLPVSRPLKYQGGGFMAPAAVGHLWHGQPPVLTPALALPTIAP